MKELDTIWNVIHQWEEDSLGNRSGRGHTDGDDDGEFAKEYDDVCHAMAVLTETKEKAEGRFNGWTNHATWKVNLEFFDGHALGGDDGLIDDDRLAEIVKEEREDQEAFCRRHFDNQLDRDTWVYTCVKRWLADYLREMVTTSVSDRLNPEFNEAFKSDPFISIMDGWLHAWLEDVNWMEILDHMLDGDDHFANLFCEGVKS